ncbi:MAG: sulfatase-like hydrolase/transferase [Proteobacteria bacterium]|nr:sulfatase-like hydrolase/transferase [Pseudomonadota bacterium]
MSQRAATGLLLLWIVLLGAMAFGARPVAEDLRAQGMLARAVAVGGLLGAVLCARFLRRDDDRHPVVPWIPMGLTFVAAGWLTTYWNLPEERVHVVQYLPLGVLAWRALGGKAALAFGLVAVVGAGDELLQGTVPDRTFDPWDVVANAIAGGAGVLLACGGSTSWAAVALLVAARLILPVLHVGHPGATADLVQYAGSDPVAVGTASTVFPEAAVHYAGSDPGSGDPGSGAGGYGGHHLLLVTIDALRADRVPPGGRAGVPLPSFDRLAAEAISFDGATANSIWTTPSMVSFFSGLWPAVHGVQERGQELAPGIRTPVEALAEAGWHTVGYAGDATETYRNLGFAEELDRDADPVDELVRHLARAGPTFLWLHLRDIHAPYEASPEQLAALGLPDRLPDSPLLDRARTQLTVPRADFPGRHGWLREPIAALYDAEVADADAVLGRLLDALPERTILVVSADHGEELLERDGIGHASTTLDSVPHPELVRIPMLVRLPDGRGAGRRIQGRFEQVDLLATLLPLLDVEAPPDADGRDWSGILLDEAAPPPRSRDLLVSSTPCGWQCPEGRRSERVHTLISDPDWSWCREDSAPCEPGRLATALEEARDRRTRLGTPVPSPR